MIEKLVTSPRAFVQDQILYRGTRTQTFIAIAVGLAFAAQHVGTYLRLGDVGVELYEVIAISVAIVMLVPFLLWWAATLVIVILARFTVGRLTTGDIYRLTGWGLLPLAAAGLIQSLGRLYALRGVEPPDLGAFSYIAVEWERYIEYLDTATGDPVFVAATVVALALVLFTWYVWTLVVEEVGYEDQANVTTVRAAVTSAVPAGLCALWILQPFLA